MSIPIRKFAWRGRDAAAQDLIWIADLTDILSGSIPATRRRSTADVLPEYRQWFRALAELPDDLDKTVQAITD